jgi:hypothetical protein
MAKIAALEKQIREKDNALGDFEARVAALKE